MSAGFYLFIIIIIFSPKNTVGGVASGRTTVHGSRRRWVMQIHHNHLSSLHDAQQRTSAAPSRLLPQLWGRIRQRQRSMPR